MRKDYEKFGSFGELRDKALTGWGDISTFLSAIMDDVPSEVTQAANTVYKFINEQDEDYGAMSDKIDEGILDNRAKEDAIQDEMDDAADSARNKDLSEGAIDSKAAIVNEGDMPDGYFDEPEDGETVTKTTVSKTKDKSKDNGLSPDVVSALSGISKFL